MKLKFQTLYLTMLVMLALFFASVLLSSCSIRGVSKFVTKTLSDSSSAVYKDTMTVKKTDVKKTEKKDSIVKKEETTTDEVSIDFDDRDTTKHTDPIVITKDSTGKTTIDVGGRKVKAVHDKTAKSKKNGTEISNTTTTNTSTTDSSSKKESSKTEVKKQTESNVVIKKGMSAIGIILWLWPLWVLILLYIGYRWLKKYYTLPF